MKTTGKNLNFHFLILAILVLLFPILTFAHPGGLGADGCHVCKTNCEKWGLSTGERHCHNSSAPAPAPAPTPPPPPPASPSPSHPPQPPNPPQNPPPPHRVPYRKPPPPPPPNPPRPPRE